MKGVKSWWQLVKLGKNALSSREYIINVGNRKFPVEKIALKKSMTKNILY